MKASYCPSSAIALVPCPYITKPYLLAFVPALRSQDTKWSSEKKENPNGHPLPKCHQTCPVGLESS